MAEAIIPIEIQEVLGQHGVPLHVSFYWNGNQCKGNITGINNCKLVFQGTVAGTPTAPNYHIPANEVSDFQPA